MPRRNLFRRTDSWEFGHENPAQEHPLEAPKKRRAATTVAFAALFFAGAAFTAVAGDKFTQMTAADNAAATDAVSADATTTDASASGDAASAAADPSAAPAPAPSDSADPTTDASASGDAAPAADPSAAPAPSDSADPSSGTPAAGSSSDAAAATGADNADFPTLSSSSSSSSAPSGASSSGPQSASGGGSAPAKASKAKTPQRIPLHALLFPQARPAHRKSAPPEIEGPAQNATIWLNSPLPDPTPAALRLSPKFARHLRAAAAKAGIDWSLELGILRAKGLIGHVPANAPTLNALAGRLSSLTRLNNGAWAIALAYDGKANFADKAQALARYDRAVGLDALVNGLEAAKPMIAQRLLNDPEISISPGGRNDIANGKVDVRVLALISYLRVSFGQVTVTSLISGHRLFARPGVVSAHVYGRAVDIAGLGGTPILGHQEPGGLTEQAVRDLLLLPAELLPKQVISLLGLGGPSFPLADHYNHIHIGY